MTIKHQNIPGSQEFFLPLRKNKTGSPDRNGHITARPECWSGDMDPGKSSNRGTLAWEAEASGRLVL